eukprot:gene15307-21392_t
MNPGRPQQELYQQIESAVQRCASPSDSSASPEASSTDHVTVIFDSVSVFSSLGIPQKEWLTFLHYCLALGSQLEVPSTCAMLSHVDVPDDLPWIRFVESVAEVTFDVVPLEGRLADIDGQVTITRRSLPSSSSTSRAGVGGAMVEADFDPNTSLYFRATGGDTSDWGGYGQMDPNSNWQGPAVDMSIGQGQGTEICVTMF